MLFNSLHFLCFFPVVVFVYYIVPNKIKNLWLLIASYYFYMCWNAKYAALLLFSTVVTYLSGLFMEKVKCQGWDFARTVKYKKIIVGMSFLINLSILFYFKYINFALDSLCQMLKAMRLEWNSPVFDIVLPVGISFYTFQALSYTMDVYRDEIYAERSFFRYALFVSFFPQLVAGPIERSKNLLKQLSEQKGFRAENVWGGAQLMLWGYFLKLVIAERCAVLVNTVYGDYASYTGFQMVVANVSFAFQIYCDFMGYSVIAKGAAKILGYDLMDNFSQPYLAQSMKDFWRRWHISLSSWLRDYLYIPMGGGRRSRGIKYRNLMVTFLVSGLWHGADVTFVIWGGLHGLYQIAEEMLSPVFSGIYKRLRVDTGSLSWKCLRMAKTFILADVAWVFFRADTLTSALYIIKKSLDFSNFGLILNGGVYQLGLDERNMAILFFGLIVLTLHGLMKETGHDIREWMSRQNTIFRYAIYWAAALMITFSLDIGGQEFIYFQF